MKRKSVFLTIAVLLGLRIAATAQTIPSYVPTDGLVGWWPFNGNANDESGNGNNGTVNGATLTEDRFGNGNAAYGFDLNYILVGNSPSFNFSNSMCINVWYNVSETANELTPNMAFVSKHIGSSLLSSFAIYNENLCGPTAYLTDVNLSVSFVNDLSFCDSVDWHMATLNLQGGSLSLYLDGALIGNTSVQSEIQQTDLPLVFGGFNNSSIASDIMGRMLGALDDIGIWNRALTQEEITDLYNANLCYEYITVTDTLIINLNPTGFNPLTYANTILMYPNPTSEELTINYGDFASLAGYTLKIFNSIGQEIHSANINQQQEVLQLGTWGGAGTYQVVIYNAQGVPVDTRTIVLQ